jgi:hypothetical protein
VAAIFFVRLYRWIIAAFVAPKYKVPIFLQWFGLQFMIVGFLMLKSFSTTYETLSPAGWLLDTEAVRTLVESRGSDSVTVNMTKYDEEADLFSFRPLVLFSLTMPFWVVGSFVVCLFHTWQHVNETRSMNKHHVHEDTKRDSTILVLALPAIYGLMAFKAVVHVWQVIVNQPMGFEFVQNWEDRKDFYDQMYESCFMVGDVYEAMALYMFGVLTVSCITEKVHKQAESAKNDKQGSAATDEFCKTGNDLAHSLHGLTVIGIRYFCLSCIFQAFYYITTIGLKYNNYDLGITKEQEALVSSFFTGTGTIASFAAIENIIVVEHAFGETLLEAFSPAKKFWSAKVLVSLSFLQKCLLVLPPFSHWSPTQQNLWFSTLITFECFVIALFHLLAWGHKEEWYDKTEGQQPLLA